MTKRKALGFGLVALAAVAGTVLQARGLVAPRRGGRAARRGEAVRHGSGRRGARRRLPRRRGARRSGAWREARARPRRGGRRRPQGTAPGRDRVRRAAAPRSRRLGRASPRRRRRGGSPTPTWPGAGSSPRRRSWPSTTSTRPRATSRPPGPGWRRPRRPSSRYEALLAKSRIVAPIAGTVVARKIDAGQMVETGDHAFTVADLGRLRIEGEAHEADAEAVTLGAEVTITADGYPGPLVARPGRGDPRLGDAAAHQAAGPQPADRRARPRGQGRLRRARRRSSSAPRWTCASLPSPADRPPSQEKPKGLVASVDVDSRGAVPGAQARPRGEDRGGRPGGRSWLLWQRPPHGA